MHLGQFEIILICICVLVGFLCSQSSKIKIEPYQSETQQLISILEEWKELDTTK